MRLYLVLLGILISATAVAADQDRIEQETAVYSALSMGTGWALTHRHIVTNFHVIDGMRNLRIVTGSQKEIPVKLVIADEKNDLAVLSIEDNKTRIKPLPLALTKPRLGSPVFTVGYPHPNLMGTSPKLTSGIINATNGLADDPRTIQVSVPVQSGNSGGPLLNMRGEVVGVITSKLSAQKMFEWTGDIPQNVNYAIKINRLSSLISDLETDEQVIAGGTKQIQDLETLASNVIDSVIIVAGDGHRRNDEPAQTLFSVEQHHNELVVANKLKILVYSFSEPGNHDRVVDIEGSSTIPAFSKNTLNVLTKQLTDHLDGNVEFETKGGRVVNEIFYDLEEVEYSSALCSNRNADFIIASHSEDQSGHGTHFRSVYYRLFDCKTNKEYKSEYHMERDEANDNFGYEVAFYTSFKDFLIKIPPYLQWAKQ